MPDLDELIAKSLINQEHEETKAQQIEERIRKYIILILKIIFLRELGDNHLMLLNYR